MSDNKLWILRPIPKCKEWVPWYDKCFGVVVRAPDEEAARALASNENGDEGEEVWLNENKTSCIELTGDGPAEVVITDFAAA